MATRRPIVGGKHRKCAPILRGDKRRAPFKRVASKGRGYRLERLYITWWFYVNISITLKVLLGIARATAPI